RSAWITVFFGFGINLWANCSPSCGFVIPTQPATASLNGSAFNNLSGVSMRFEFRWQGPNISDGTNHAIFSIGSFQLGVINGNQLWISEFYDSVDNNGCLLLNWSGNTHTDIVGRVTRTINGSSGTLRLEIYDTAVGVSSLMSCSTPILARAARPASNF